MAKSKTSYRALISKDEKQMKEEEVGMRVSAARIATDSSLHSTKTELMQARAALKKALSAGTFSVSAILDAQDRVANLEETITRIKELKGELFEGETDD